MGFVTPGIPSRYRHLSRQKRSYKLGQPVYFEALKQHKKQRVDKPADLKLETLPVEILRRIFAYTGGYMPMSVLSRRFYQSLQPGNTLMGRVFWERYTWGEGINIGILELDGIVWSSLQYLVDLRLFANPLMCKYLLTNYDRLTLSIAYFVDEEVIQYLESNELLDDGEIRKMNVRFALREQFINDSNVPIATPYNTESEKESGYRRDFPQTFYNNMDLFFDVPRRTLMQLRKHFYIQRPYDIMTTMIPWFFQLQTDAYAPQRLIDAIALVLQLSNNDISVPDHQMTMTSTLPLTYLIAELYTFTEGGPQVLNYISTFISTFYVGVQQVIDENSTKSLLSEPELWSHLKDINNKELTSLIIKMGGEPDLTFFT